MRSARSFEGDLHEGVRREKINPCFSTVWAVPSVKYFIRVLGSSYMAKALLMALNCLRWNFLSPIFGMAPPPPRSGISGLIRSFGRDGPGQAKEKKDFLPSPVGAPTFSKGREREGKED